MSTIEALILGAAISETARLIVRVIQTARTPRPEHRAVVLRPEWRREQGPHAG